jgi:hypothetical protein
VKGATVAIAALVVWVLTAALGVTLLVTRQTARPAPAPVPARPVPATTAPPVTTAPPATAAPPVTGLAELPPIPRVRVHTPAGEHPLLEFSHPALGLVGLGLWFIFVGTHYHPLAWVAFGVLVVTIAAGLRWFIGHTRGARRAATQAGAPPARRGVPRLALVHGLAASTTFLLAVLAALAAGHG